MALAAMAHGAPDAAAQDDAAAIAAEMATLYGMALDNEEMRSHLPDRLQMQMGKRPFMYENLYYCWGGCIRDTKQHYEGFWDHEAYRRSVGEDRGAVCARAYYDLVARVGWLRDGAYWGQYIDECSRVHSGIVNRLFMSLVDEINRECEMRVIEGWFVVAGGQFRRHGGPLEGDPLFNGAAVIRPAGVDPGPGFPLFGHACLGEDSTVKNVFRSGSYHHSKAPYLPYALPPEYDPTDALGDWAEAPEASKARELGSRLAELYGMALDSAEVRSHLPREITEAISLDVPESYYVHNAYFAPLDPLDPPPRNRTSTTHRGRSATILREWMGASRRFAPSGPTSRRCAASMRAGGRDRPPARRPPTIGILAATSARPGMAPVLLAGAGRSMCHWATTPHRAKPQRMLGLADMSGLSRAPSAVGEGTRERRAATTCPQRFSERLSAPGGSPGCCRGGLGARIIYSPGSDGAYTQIGTRAGAPSRAQCLS